MHASNWFLNNICICFIALEVPVNTQPVHLTTVHHLLTPNNWNVVLTLASNNTSTAADALPKIHRHTPLGNSDSAFLIFFLQLRQWFNPRRTVTVRTDGWDMRPLHFSEFGNFLIELNRPFPHQGKAALFSLISTPLINCPMVLSS